MSEATFARRMGVSTEPQRKHETAVRPTIVLTKRDVPWIGAGVTNAIPLEEIGVQNGTTIRFGSITDLYPGSRKTSDQLTPTAQAQALEAYKRYLIALINNPGLKAHERIDLSNGAHVLGILPRVYSDSTPVPYGLVIRRTTKTGQEITHLLLGACKVDQKARDRFKQPLRES